ncbi:lipase 1-like [Planococcus citri]|uniref:lipase 1-like n=1 Tax=Planococcus citri TaxID=170843 RepID=UPI0031F95E10
MSVLNILLYIILSIYTHSPVYLINEFINGLQITSNPDTYLTPPQIITRHGYPSETYNIKTQDGFILELHRIPNGLKQGTANQYPVLLFHGYMDSSAAWIALGPDQALRNTYVAWNGERDLIRKNLFSRSYLLADEGYDVWMLNTRGNTFSQAHINYTPEQREFWDFSFHEIGVYDVPATIDFILDKSNHPKLFCITHSAGGSEIYITLSVLPQYNEKIIAQVNLAPLYHGDPSITTKATLPIIDYVYVNSFSYFDYGPKQNMEIYGTTSPPEYNISNIITQTRIYHDNLDVASSNTVSIDS